MLLSPQVNEPISKYHWAPDNTGVTFSVGSLNGRATQTELYYSAISDGIAERVYTGNLERIHDFMYVE